MTEQVDPIVGEVAKVSKASQMREMAAKNMTVSQIAKALGVRYQAVYNVLKSGKAPQGAIAAPAAPTTEAPEKDAPITTELTEAVAKDRAAAQASRKSRKVAAKAGEAIVVDMD